MQPCGVTHSFTHSLTSNCCQVEEGTPFARWFSGEGSPLPKEPEAVAMFEAASATLTAAGYEHYEVGI
jgi:coproporphyrinogen III oxidase-like Fe-S oxidoreductase